MCGSILSCICGATEGGSTIGALRMKDFGLISCMKYQLQINKARPFVYRGMLCNEVFASLIS
jgi:hypothetical protein